LTAGEWHCAFLEENCRQNALKVLQRCTLLRSLFRNATQDSSKWARCFSCDGGICSQRARVSSVRRFRELQRSAWYQVCCKFRWATRSDASVPSSEGLGRGFDGSGTGSPTTLLIGHIRSGIRLYTCQRGQTAYEFDLTALRQSSGLGSQNLPGLRTGRNLVCGYILGPWWRTVH